MSSPDHLTILFALPRPNPCLRLAQKGGGGGGFLGEYLCTDAVCTLCTTYIYRTLWQMSASGMFVLGQWLASRPVVAFCDHLGWRLHTVQRMGGCRRLRRR